MVKPTILTTVKTADITVRKARRAKGRPFMGVDGEGCGTDRRGRQHYMLLRAGRFELFTGKPLTTIDCLEFILSLPPTHILVGFAFAYDTTQILRDMPAERLSRLFEDTPSREGQSSYTYWEDYAIEYLPRNYLRVARLERVWGVRKDGSEGGIYEVIEGTTRTVWETFGFFQCSFLRALQQFDIGKRYWEEIARNKRQRSRFARITTEIRRYCELECALLASMMEKFRVICHAAGIHPNEWSGAGKLAAYLHRINGTISHAELRDRVPLPTSTEADRMAFLKLCQTAYYGGRFEITRVGELGECWEYDINSAYPAAMLSLPCLHHGTWQRVPALWLTNAPPEALFVASVSFTHPDDTVLCGLPVRRQQGHICWPLQGAGTYWSTEIRSAERLGARITYQHGWRYVSHCKCRPFDWVAPLYAERKRLDAATPNQGYPIKLGINALYGKLAQRIGSPKYGNFIHAGLITAHCRATLNNAIALDPGAVAMLATDAVVSLRPLPLPVGKQLGQWEETKRSKLFVVQPGIYWEGRTREDKRKTRGTSVSIFARHMHRFEKTWRQWAETNCRGFNVITYNSEGKWRRGVPTVKLRMTLFVGLRLAHARARDAIEKCLEAEKAGDFRTARAHAKAATVALATAGGWPRVTREYSFEWGRKRSMRAIDWEDLDTGRFCLRLDPLAGGPDWISVAHDPQAEHVKERDRRRLQLDDQRNPLDSSRPQ